MASTLKVTYTRRFTNKQADGSFESVELGGETEVEVPEFEDVEDLTNTWGNLSDAFVAAVEAKVLEAAEGTVGSTQQEAPAAKPDRLDKWVKKTVDENTEKIRPQVQQKERKTLPGERFSKPQQRDEQESDVPEPTEGEAVSFEGVKVFLDNSQSKIGKTKRGKKFGMLRLGKRGEIFGDYITGKSFEPDIVEDIEAVLDNEIEMVDVYGFYEPRSNDPDVWDLVIQGVQPANG
jgi:hypothetical protein